jgi:hypothetical protein
MDIIYSPLSFLTRPPFTHPYLMFRLKVRHNPFGTIRIISCGDPYYNILFEYCSDSCGPTYYRKLKQKNDVIYLLLFLL